MRPSRANRLTVRIALAALAVALIPVVLVGLSMTRSSEAAERGRLDAQVGLSLQAAVSDLEGALLADGNERAERCAKHGADRRHP